MAASAKDSKLLEQKDLISQLNTTIVAQTELSRKLKLILKHLLLKSLSIPVRKNVLLRNFLKEFHHVMRSFHFLKMRESAMSAVQHLNL